MVCKATRYGIFTLLSYFTIVLCTSDNQSHHRTVHNLCEEAKEYILSEQNLAAIALLQEAVTIDPNHVRAHFYLANALFNSSDYEKAYDEYIKCSHLLPNNPDIYCNLGVCANMMNNTDEAIEFFAKAISIENTSTLAHLQLIASLEKAEKYPQAFVACKRFLSLNPEHREGLLCAAGIAKRLEQFEEAEWYYRTVYNRDATDFQAIIELAAVLTTLEEYEEALKLYKEALILKPDSISVCYNLGFVLKKLGHLTETIGIYQQLLAQKPDYALVHFSLGLTYLMLGNFEDGLPEYEWRWQAYGETPALLNIPRWDGSSLAGKKIFIYAEQGYGDTFQFARYLKMLKEKGAYVIFAPQHALISFMKLVPYIDEIISSDQRPSACDFQAPLMSLPLLCKTTKSTIPAPIPYLTPDVTLVEKWAPYFDALSPSTYRIGICWHGNSQYKDISLRRAVAQKSCPLALFAMLAQLPNVELFSLQKISGLHELSSLDDTSFVHLFPADLDTVNGRFMDTAAIISHLDLVITVDTSIAHLAAGLGVETWNLLPEPADWRWMIETSETPWYPNMHLFRQAQRSDWYGLMVTVQEALREKTALPRNTEKTSMKQKSADSVQIIITDLLLRGLAGEDVSKELVVASALKRDLCALEGVVS